MARNVERGRGGKLGKEGRGSGGRVEIARNMALERSVVGGGGNTPRAGKAKEDRDTKIEREREREKKNKKTVRKTRDKCLAGRGRGKKKKKKKKTKKKVEKKEFFAFGKKNPLPYFAAA
ncbi:MAG: hypothetical protein BJ554DRAFT_2242 [Olpidium bornovanus]|uniref:Uncharacterized protein n=1 Tax=Olpidium bornovanus TaxID=278681 RepID=A0A8H7ZR32_9FUNG|nr:MAG: hypothetical protein BJ554DRAFT_2242 [Olpidium bornovanus]